MKRIKSIIMLIIGIALTACSEYSDPLDLSVQPGHIYCTDGSIVAPSQFNKSKTPLGIVFWANTKNDPKIEAKAYAVGLTDISPTKWASLNIHIPNVSTDMTDFAGLSNTVAMIAYDQKDTLIAVSSSRLVESYMPNTSWFIPSAGQLKALHNQRENIQKSINIAKGDNLGNWYWTSTEDATSQDASDIYALVVSIENGTITPTSKQNKYPIRPIITIK